MVKPWTRRLAIGGGALAAGGLYLAGRDTGPRRRAPPPRGVLRRGNAAEPGSLDPALVQMEQEDSILGDLLTGLIVTGPRNTPEPGMALSWEASADGLTWTFHLREALWSDGVPVTAGDFVFAWRRILTPAIAAPYAYFLYVIRNAAAVNAGKMPPRQLGARAVDDRTLEVKLEHPAPYFIEMLAHMSMYPLPRHIVTAKGKAWARPGNYVGNGAFTLAEWVPNDHITLNKNGRFYDAANVALEKVIFYPTTDYGAALQRFRAGEIDSQDRIATEQIDWIRTHIPETIKAVPQLTVEYLIVNHTRKPFDDIRVRAALNMVINREAISGRIRRVGDTPAYNIVPPGVANFPGGSRLPFAEMGYPERIKQAQALMRQAGFDSGKRLKTTYMIRSTSAGSYRAVAAAIQQMFTLIYVDVSILPNEFPVFSARTTAHDFDICQPGWGADFNDAETFLSLFQTGGGNNWGAYSNKTFDSLLAKSQQETSMEKRGVLLVSAEAMLLQDEAAMPLFFWVNPSMAWPYLHGWTANSQNVHRSRWITIDEEARRKKFT